MFTQSRRNVLVNLDIKPLPDPSTKKHLGITLGDLHANVVKFLFFLIIEGVVGTTDENYDELVALYNEPYPQDKIQYLVKFAKETFLIKKIINDLTIKKKETLVRLIGDELADRGKNDFYILLLLAKLHQEKVTVEILISNHSIEFIKAYEQKKPFKSDLIGHLCQSISMERLQELLDLGLTTRAEIEQIVNSAYLPKLKLISYTIETNGSGIRLYSHAPIDLAIVQKIAAKLGISYQDNTVTSLAQTIDSMNIKFQENYVVPGKINVLFNKLEDFTDPFTQLIWNRDYSTLNREIQHHNYNVCYIHGHDSNEPSSQNIINLDNNLGKPGLNQGLFEVLQTTGLNLSELKKIKSNNLFSIETAFRKAVSLAAQSNPSSERERLLQGIDALKKETLDNFQKEGLNFKTDDCLTIANSTVTLAKKVHSNTLTQADINQFSQVTGKYKTTHRMEIIIALIISAIAGIVVGAAIGFAAAGIPGVIVGATTGLVTNVGLAGTSCTLWYNNKEPRNKITSAATEFLPKP